MATGNSIGPARPAARRRGPIRVEESVQLRLKAQQWFDRVPPPWMGRRFSVGISTTCAVLATACVAMGLAGCSTARYRSSADEEVYALIESKTPEVPGMPPAFSLDGEETSKLGGLPLNEEQADYLGTEAKQEVGAPILSLEKALDTAFKHSREYRNREENLYLRALGLTLARHQFRPLFSGSVSGNYARSTRDETRLTQLGQFLETAPELSGSIQELTGRPADLLNDYTALVGSVAALTGAPETRETVVDERSVSAGSELGLNLLLKSGARFALNLTTDFLRFLTGDPRDSAVSVLTGSLTQPLLRGRGKAAVMENLSQAERDLLYELRDFTRFRKTFSVRVASLFYGVLRDRDTVRNSYLAMNSFSLNLEREQALANEGLSTPAQVGRFEQAQLSAESRWINTIRRYKQGLDNFKILLGLSTDAPLVLDDAELAALGERGLIHPSLRAAEAVAVALVTRLDLYTGRDRVEDSGRRIRVAANALRPGLDLVFTGTVDSKDGNRPFSPDLLRARWNAGIDVDLPLDRKAERNTYRAALIEYERALRTRDLLEDEVKLEVREAWRALDQTKRNYEISSQAVDLNVRRVEEQDLRAELGLGNVLDQVDAQDDLTDAKNDLTGQLIAHTVARLEFWRDIGILFIKENGQWEEMVDVEES